MKRWYAFALIALSITLVSDLPPILTEQGQNNADTAHPYSRIASPEKLEEAYKRWAAKFEENGGTDNLLLHLGEAPGLSAERSYANGLVTVNLGAGTIDVAVANLKPGDWEVWLIDNQPGENKSTLPEAGDLIRSLGQLQRTEDQAVLEARLDSDVGIAFDIDRIIVTRAGDRPEDRPVLFGAATLFERLYMRSAGKAPQQARATLPWFAPPVAFADSPFNSSDPLVAMGADLFFNETFNGNGRTCGTCHPAENNFTIDARFVAQLSDDDPLFVSETVPALADLENPILLRTLGLISVPIDGFENPVVQRAVPHLLGLSRYLEPGNQSVPPLQRTGWSGDGAPGSGTLREFALGAVTAHYTQTLDRIPGVDFRLPSDEELDAIEAFLLVLGRQDFPDISEITMLGPVPEAGRQLFNVFAADASLCTFCHQEGGANGPNTGLNNNFDIGISSLEFHPADVIDPGSLTPDGGFGTDPLIDPDTNEFLGFGTFNAEENVNERRFNSFPAIEAVDTAPFFHNHAVATIEEAVDYYNSEAFLTAPSSLPIKMSTTEVEAIAAFLRVMNTLENIRSSNLVATAAMEESNRGMSKRLAELAAFDTEDGYQVLDERFLHPSAISKLKQAYYKERLASRVNSRVIRNRLLARAIELKEEARAELVIDS